MLYLMEKKGSNNIVNFLYRLINNKIEFQKTYYGRTLPYFNNEKNFLYLYENFNSENLTLENIKNGLYLEINEVTEDSNDRQIVESFKYEIPFVEFVLNHPNFEKDRDLNSLINNINKFNLKRPKFIKEHRVDKNREHYIGLDNINVGLIILNKEIDYIEIYKKYDILDELLNKTKYYENCYFYNIQYKNKHPFSYSETLYIQTFENEEYQNLSKDDLIMVSNDNLDNIISDKPYLFQIEILN